MTQEDVVNKPKHYHQGGIDVIEYMTIKFPVSQTQGFFRGNVLKYLMRYEHKNGIQDLEKAQYYLTKLIETMKEEK